jgi:glycosyltransferase involved in cell wall biosynthesis
MPLPSTVPPVKRVLYHHRTQGKAVEGVHIRSITDALRKEGVAVDIISLPGADPYATPKAMSPTRQAKWWMRIVTKLPEPLFELSEVAYNVVAIWRMNKYLKSHADVGFIYERYSLYMFAGVWLAQCKKLPIILEVNDSATVHRVRPLFFSGLALKLERWIFNKADGLVFVSTQFRDHVQNALGGMAPSIITPNAANIDKFSFTPEQRAQARTKWGLESSVVCGYLGAFIPWHKIDQFVYKIADQLAKAPNLKLLLVGDGATFDELAKFVQDRGLSQKVIMTGRVSHDEVPGLLAAMDLAVLPSAGDYTSPVKLFEFMACAVPPIAPDFAPIKEVLQENETGWTFKAGDLDQAVQAVLSRSQDPATLARVGQAAREYIKAHRQWRHNVQQLLAFYEERAASSQR